MSENLDDCSPVSDSNKMDISSEPTTISQASPPTISSPESETTKRNDVRNSHDDIYAHNMPTMTNDNGNSVMSNRFRALTLADTHPLMPRLSVDDDDSPFTADTFSYPDVVPQHEQTNAVDTSVSRIDDNAEILMNFAVDTQHVQPEDNKCSKMLALHKQYSSDSEPDISQYQASVEPTFQSVSLTNNLPAEKSEALMLKPGKMRKIALTPELMMSADELSSVETISNNSFDDDFDDASELGFDDEDDEGGGGGGGGGSGARRTKSNTTKSNGGRNDDTGFNEMSNENDDDRVDDGNGSIVIRDAVTLPDGQTRDIDMKVIEPYKRVLSHGGYLKAGGHNAIVVFAGCYLPDRSRTDYNYVMENLFLYVLKTLDQLVTEDYMLIYLHGGSSRSTLPPFPWLKKCYQLLDRRIRKSLKNLYIVHPTFWLKSIVWMTRPFISSKFWRKLVYIRTLDELYQQIPVEKAAVPDKVKRFDMKYV